MEFEEPLRVGQLLANLPCPWYVCGGWAIDLFVERVTRLHKDVDVAIARGDQAVVQRYLRGLGWRLEKVANGELTPWEKGERLELPVHGVWCRNERHTPDFVEILLDEIDATHFRYRRDPSVAAERDRMWFRTRQGLPVLAPEIVLLYKSTAARDNEADFGTAVGRLNDGQRAWLRGALARASDAHPWIERL
jgi:Aminoglycoside-2''-adenylyltransferase